MSKQKFEQSLHTQRAETEAHIRVLQKENRHTAAKKISFGAIVWSGLAAGVLGMAQLLCAAASLYLMGVVISGFATFAFGMPIFVSFKKGIIYSEA